jgi:hypothetical protein
VHKNKKRKMIEEKIAWKKQIALSVCVVIAGIVAAKFVVDWLKTTPIMQPHYAKPGEVNLDNGLPILITYCICLACMIVGGFILERRIEQSNEVKGKDNGTKRLVTK